MRSGRADGVSGRERPAVHVLIPTHTTRHLGICLGALARQTLSPASIVVSCDTDAAEIGQLLDRLSPEVCNLLRERSGRAPKMLHAARPHQGEARLNQVRNNGLRALQSHASPSASDLVVVIDGDMALAPDAIEKHAEMARRADVIVPFRINLTEAQTATLDLSRLLDPTSAWPKALIPGPAHLAALRSRHRRYQRQLLTRRLAPWLTKPHKPKLLGGHHAVRWNALLSVNGYDEAYVGYGYDDDDLARRLHQSGRATTLRWQIAVRDIIAHHLWHPTRAPSDPTEAPGYARFATAGLPFRTARGLDHPFSQPEPVVRSLAAALVDV